MTSTPVTSADAETGDDTPAVPDRRGGRRPRDMALSLLVLIVPIVLILAIYRGLHGGDEPVTVDPAPEIARAAQANLTAVPHELPASWKVVTSRYDGRDKTLRLGYLTAANDGLQLVESPRDGLVKAELTEAARQTGTIQIGAAQWQTWTGREKENALVRTAGAVTIVISGEVDQKDLVALAERL